MTGLVLPFSARPEPSCGVVHVMGDSVDGFYVSHESASGNLWGALFGPFASGQEAITRAHALNRNDYEGTCEVAVNDTATMDARLDACPHRPAEDF